jgi:hypothetical protein
MAFTLRNKKNQNYTHHYSSMQNSFKLLKFNINHRNFVSKDEQHTHRRIRDLDNLASHLLT